MVGMRGNAWDKDYEDIKQIMVVQWITMKGSLESLLILRLFKILCTEESVNV